MKRDPTGGPAFPVTFEHADCTSEQMGMNLRDYFAAKAMQVWMFDNAMRALNKETDGLSFNDEDIAEFAYATADAMLKARNEE